MRIYTILMFMSVPFNLCAQSDTIPIILLIDGKVITDYNVSFKYELLDSTVQFTYCFNTKENSIDIKYLLTKFQSYNVSELFVDVQYCRKHYNFTVSSEFIKPSYTLRIELYTSLWKSKRRVVVVRNGYIGGSGIWYKRKI